MLERIAIDKHSSLLCLTFSDEETKFYHTDTSSQCYKTVFFVIQREAKKFSLIFGSRIEPTRGDHLTGAPLKGRLQALLDPAGEACLGQTL